MNSQAATCVALCCLWASTALGEEPIRMLFAGSSSTYQHDLPGQAAQWITAASGQRHEARIAGRSGDGIHVYLRPDFNRYQYGVPAGKTFLQAVQDSRYNLVVLQVVNRFITGAEGDEHAAAVARYCREIRAAGGEPVFYEMGWGADEEAGRRRIFETAVANRVTRVIPCSTAWTRVRRERPELELFNPPDRVHPGTLGTYLNLCCFTAALTQKLPQQPPPLRVWRHFADQTERANALRDLANQPSRDAYVASLPEWLRQNSLLAQTVEVPAATAEYLRKVALETSRDMQARLAAAQAASPSPAAKPP